MTTIREGGYTLREIQDCHTYEEYQQMATASLNIVYNRLQRLLRLHWKEDWDRNIYICRCRMIMMKS